MRAPGPAYRYLYKDSILFRCSPKYSNAGVPIGMPTYEKSRELLRDRLRAGALHNCLQLARRASLARTVP